MVKLWNLTNLFVDYILTQLATLPFTLCLCCLSCAVQNIELTLIFLLKMAQKFNQIKEQLNKALHESNKPWTNILADVEKRTGVDRLYISIGLIAVVALWLVFGYAAQLVCNSVGFLYPAYVSIHAIESKSKEDDTKWLTYWVVFAIFSIVEYFADFIVGWFPLYWLIKCLFFVWLMNPTELNGSLIIYKKIVRPYFLKHQNAIDKTLNAVKEKASTLLEQKKQ